MQKLTFNPRYASKASFKKAGGKIVGSPEMLFPPNWDALKIKKCPMCGLNLYQTFNKKMWVCRSKKRHKKPFVITDKKLKRYT